MNAAHSFRAVEVGERAGDPQHAMIAPGGEPHGVRCIAQKRKPGRIRACRIFEHGAVRRGVGADMRKADRSIALRLHFARAQNALCHFAASLRWRRQDEIGRGDRRHLDVQIDAVEERPGKPRLIIGGTACILPRLQVKPGSLARPQRHGFIAATSMNRAG